MYNSLANLSSYLNQRKKQKKKAKIGERLEPEDPTSGAGWLPWTHSHKLSIQARGGIKSRPISITLPGRTPIPLHDFVSLCFPLKILLLLMYHKLVADRVFPFMFLLISLVVV